MKALVTGADGFVGRWLVEHLVDAGDDVIRAVGRQSPTDAATVHPIDITDHARVAELVSDAAPDAIFHLAAVAFGPDAARSVAHAVRVTVDGTAALLAAAARLPTPPIVLIPSSSEVYGVPERLPIDETHPLQPAAAYGATKLAQESVGRAFDLAGDVPVVIARAFNHIGPGQRREFVVASLATQLSALARRQNDRTLVVGNLAAERDFTDVRDVVRAYRALVERRVTGRPVNIASGRTISIGDLLRDLMAIARVDVDLRVDPARLRPHDPPRIVGSAALLQSTTGWHPSIAWHQTLQDIWDDAQHRI